MSLDSSILNEFTSYISDGDEVIKLSSFNIPLSRFLWLSSSEQEIRWSHNKHQQKFNSLLISEIKRVDRTEQHFAFVIITKARKYHFYARNHEMREKWVVGLSRQLQGTSWLTPIRITKPNLTPETRETISVLGESNTRPLKFTGPSKSSILSEIKSLLNSAIDRGQVHIAPIASFEQLPDAINTLVYQSEPKSKIERLKNKLQAVQEQRESLAEQLFIQYDQISKLKDELKEAKFQVKQANQAQSTAPVDADMDILMKGFDGQVAWNDDDYFRNKVFVESGKICWENIGLFKKVQDSIAIWDISSAENGAAFRPLPTHVYLTIKTSDNQWIYISVEKEYEHYLTSLKSILGCKNYNIDECEKYKKSFEHANARLDLLTWMIRNYKSSLLDSICTYNNDFSNQQSIYRAEIIALQEMSVQFKSYHEERDEMLQRLQKMNELVVQANREKLELMEENQCKKRLFI